MLKYIREIPDGISLGKLHEIIAEYNRKYSQTKVLAIRKEDLREIQEYQSPHDGRTYVKVMWDCRRPGIE